MQDNTKASATKPTTKATKGSQTEIKDFDQPVMTAEQQQEQMRLYMENYNRNEVKIAGTVRAKFEGEAKPKIDKKTNEHILVDGVPQFWEPFRSVTISFDGGEVDINVDKKQFAELVEGTRYLFVGTKGLNYGRVTDKFHSITCI